MSPRHGPIEWSVSIDQRRAERHPRPVHAPAAYAFGTLTPLTRLACMTRTIGACVMHGWTEE